MPHLASCSVSSLGWIWLWPLASLPKMVANFFSGWQSISFLACGTQIFFSLTVIVRCILITVMCFDRYVAICNPLRYLSSWGPRMCWQMAAMSWAGGALAPLATLLSPYIFTSVAPERFLTSSVKSWLFLGLFCEDISAKKAASGDRLS